MSPDLFIEMNQLTAHTVAKELTGDNVTYEDMLTVATRINLEARR